MSIAGGTPPYDVLWNDGTVGDTALTELGTGVYSWVVEDANGCLLLGLQNIINMGSPFSVGNDPGWSLNETSSGWRLSGHPEPGDQVEVYSLTGQCLWSEPLRVDHSIGSTNRSLPVHGIVRVVDDEGRTSFSGVY